MDFISSDFGTIFHPLAISRILNYTINSSTYLESQIFKQNDKWRSWDTGKGTSSNSKQDLLEQIHSKINFLKTSLENATHLIITLGSAWGYRHNDLNVIVSNCQKARQEVFIKRIN